MKPTGTPCKQSDEVRLIDANAAYKKIWYGNTDSILLRKYASGIIENAPTVNAVMIPCNIGDTVYVAVFAVDGTGSHICERICSGIHISEKVTRWKCETPVRYLILKTDDGRSIRIRMDEIGKTLFFTRSEAEDALRNGKPRKTVAAPVQHGQWTGFDPYIGSTECSECGYKIVFTGAKYNYCPNCGAKMDLEESNENA